MSKHTSWPSKGIRANQTVMSSWIRSSKYANFRSWSSRRKFTVALKTTAAIGSVSTIAFYWPEIDFIGSTIARSSRTAFTLGLCSLDYKRNYPFEDKQKSRDDEITNEELEERIMARKKVHRGAAEKLLTLFRRNGGIYIKLGQHMAALEHILPLEYSNTMVVLQNEAPQSTVADVEAVVREDLGISSLSDVFDQFDERPLGAASLAQVHRARLKETGQEVAVKVQHHRLHAYVDMDMLTVSAAVKVIKYIFPQFEFGWLADEMRTNLPKELDFISEAHNSERVSRNLERTWPVNCPVKIPKIFWDFTSKRVLTMEFTPGQKITDIEWMKGKKIDPQVVSSSLTHLYSQMIFLHGFVHCDPHPGNIFVQHEPKSANGFKIILLDHGLYRELPDNFRLTYAKLWKALIDGDEGSIRVNAEKLGGGDAYKLFSTVLTHRSWDSMVHNKDWDKPRNPIDVAKFREKASEFLPIVAELLSRLPRPLLLLLKTNDLLRAIDRAIHEDNPKIPSPTFIIMGEYCTVAINEDRWRKARGNLVAELKALLRNAGSSFSIFAKSIVFRLYVSILKLYISFS